ncbi:MAG: type II secretion system protein GspD [Coraliomargarita sp.]
MPHILLQTISYKRHAACWFISLATLLHCAVGQETPEEEEAISLDAALHDDHAGRLQEFQMQIANGRQDADKEIVIYDCNYVQASTLRRVLEEFITSEGMVAESTESDQLVVSDRTSNIPQLRSIIERLDKPVPQILVEARIVELNIESDLEKEVDLFYEDITETITPDGDPLFLRRAVGSKLGVPGAAPTVDQGGIVDAQIWDNGSESLNVFIRYLETNGKAKILSAPNLIIQRGKEGSIVTGEEVPILSQTTSSGGVTTSTEFKSVGIKLSVKPTMISGDRVRIEVNPEVSTVIGFSTAGDVSNPIIAVRQARTELEVKDGQLISMAGLLQSTDRDTERRTPGLSEVPLLGAFFKSNRDQSTQTQLIIFLNIKILEFGEETIIQPDNLDPKITEEIERIETKNEDLVEEPSAKNDIRNFFGLESDDEADEGDESNE